MRPTLLLKRVAVVGLSATMALTMLAGFMAWVVLNADWQVPDRRELAAPSVLLDRDGRIIARFTSTQDRQPVPLSQISVDAANAVIAAEDVRFREHTGVDPVALFRAVYRNVRTGGIEQGGSTLTQQFVKNGFEGVGDERTILRKVREAVVSIAVERSQDKDSILEAYLNTSYFGEGAYGIEAAAREYFGIRAARLTAAQGATLAQALPRPSERNPRVDPDGARTRRDRVLRTMRDAGLIDEDELASALTTELDVVPRQPVDITNAYFTEYVRKQLVQAYGEEAVLTGGLEVTTTLDTEVQAAVDAAVEEILPQQDGDNADVDAGVIAMDPLTGDVLAIHGGRDFATQQQDLATQGRRQNGSTFKPIGFLAALEAGQRATDIVSTASQTLESEDCNDQLGEPWKVAGPGGSMELREALTRSVNVAFQTIGCTVGPQAILDMAARLGVRNVIDPVPAVALGGAGFGASVLDIASAYSTIAFDGRYCPARTVIEVVDADGDELEPFDEVTIVPDMETMSRAPDPEFLATRDRSLAARDTGRCFGALDRDRARDVTAALREVVARTTGRRANIDRPQAGKTGTTDDEGDAWFVGYTPNLVIAVWVGHTESNDPIRDIGGFRKVQGGTIPALIWKAAAEAILGDSPALNFPERGEDEAATRVPAPERERPTPTPSPTPTPTPTETASDEPTDEPTCFLIFCG